MFLDKAKIVVAIKEKIEKSDSSTKAKAKKLRKLLEKLTKSPDVKYI